MLDVIGALTDLGWSGVGLVIGYLLGLFTRVVTDGTAPDWGDRARRLLGVVVLIAAVAAGVSVYRAQDALRDQAACEAAYSQAFNRALRARLEATEDERVAQRTLLRGVLGEGSSHPAVRDYIAALERLEHVRRANPLPDRPNCARQ